MNTLDPQYVTGFAEGEAAFTYISKRAPIFSIRQRYDYGDIIYAVAEFFGVGRVYECNANGHSKPNTYYRVNRLRDLVVITNHFDKYPLKSRKKQSAYIAWKSLVEFKHLPRKLQDPIKLKELLSVLSNLNCRGIAIPFDFL